MQKVILAVLLAIGLVFAQNAIITYPSTTNAILSGPGLATPWTNSLNESAGCNQAFIQGSWFDPNTNTIAAYNPLIITAGQAPGVTPTAPVLPNGAVVALWFGFNGGTITLADATNGAALAAGNCINGIAGSIFGQYAYCNAQNFFQSAIGAVNNGLLKVPPLGMANDGQTCPTTRDFFVIDMDQSDNVVTSYFVTTTQLIAQGTLSNQNQLGNNIVNTLTNASDLRLLSIAMDSAMGCTPYTVPDKAETTTTNNIPTYGTVELQANTYQAAPVALVPITHAMTRVNNQPSLTKTNAYRIGAGQPQAVNALGADGTIYCQNFYTVGPRRLLNNQQNFANFASPAPATATSLFAFLAQRMFTSFGPDGLTCTTLLNVANPVIPIMNMNGVFVGATINPPGGVNTNTLSTTNIIIIVVCTVVGGLLIVGLIAGVIWYRNRSMYS